MINQYKLNSYILHKNYCINKDVNYYFKHHNNDEDNNDYKNNNFSDRNINIVNNNRIINSNNSGNGKLYTF